MPDIPPYLLPYHRAARTHGGNFSSLLWASQSTQHIRFEVLQRAVNFAGRTVCDAGCGRADLLDWLVANDLPPVDYLGIEAINDLASAAERKQREGVRILRGDFIREPVRLFVGAEIVVFCGSLNTVEDEEFYQTLKRGFDATAWALVFNFLSSPALAGASHLRWRTRGDVERFVSGFGAVETRVIEDYLDGDTTMALFKPDPHM